MQGRDTVRDVIAFPKNSNGEDPMVESPGPMHRKQLEAYHLKVVPRDRLEFLREQQHAKHVELREGQKGQKAAKAKEGKNAIQTQSPVEDGKYLREYLDDLKVLPRDKPEGIEKIHQPPSSAAVMVGDSDPIKTYLAEVISPSLKSVLLNPDMIANGQVQLHEFTGLVGESTLDTLKLEKKATAEAKRGRTMWGQKVEEVHGATAPKTGEKTEERPSDPGNLADAVKPPL